VTDKELLDDMQCAAERLGKKSMKMDEYLYEGKYHPGTINHRFGSWNKALLRAGLKITRLKYVSDHELILNLKSVWDKLGRQPMGLEMVKPLSLFGITTYVKHFGTWLNAVRYFVKFANKGKLLTENIRHKNIIKAKQNMENKKYSRKISKSMRFDVLKRDNFMCKICGMSPVNNPEIKLHVDHIVPVAKGGETIITNLQTLCIDCNLGKAAKPVRLRRAAKSNSKKQIVNNKRKKLVAPKAGKKVRRK